MFKPQAADHWQLILTLGILEITSSCLSCTPRVHDGLQLRPMKEKPVFEILQSRAHHQDHQNHIASNGLNNTITIANMHQAKLE